MIYRQSHQVNFSVRSNALLQDNSLSDSAYRLLNHLLSLPPDWTIYPKQLMKYFSWSRDKTYKALKELRDRGYAVLIRCRRSSIWKIYESPLMGQSDESPCVEIAEEPSNVEASKIPYSKNSYSATTIQNNNLSVTKEKITTTAATLCESTQPAEKPLVVVSPEEIEPKPVIEAPAIAPELIHEVELVPVTKGAKPALLKTLAALTLSEAKMVLQILTRAMVLGTVQNPVGYAVQLVKASKNGTLTPLEAKQQPTLSERIANEKKSREEALKRGAMDNQQWADWFERNFGVKPQL